jgi:hypothetical protein
MFYIIDKMLTVVLAVLENRYVSKNWLKDNTLFRACQPLVCRDDQPLLKAGIVPTFAL